MHDLTGQGVKWAMVPSHCWSAVSPAVAHSRCLHSRPRPQIISTVRQWADLFSLLLQLACVRSTSLPPPCTHYSVLDDDGTGFCSAPLPVLCLVPNSQQPVLSFTRVDKAIIDCIVVNMLLYRREMHLRDWTLPIRRESGVTIWSRKFFQDISYASNIMTRSLQIKIVT